MRPTFRIKQGDVLPVLAFTLTGADGVAQDLTGATVRLSLRNAGRQLIVNRAVCIIDSAGAGTGHYTWQPSDTAAAGKLTGEFEVTFANSTVLTFPNNGTIVVLVTTQTA